MQADSLSDRRKHRDAVTRLLVAVLLLGGCVSQAPIEKVPYASNGFSGMARIDDTHYLAVHDEKSHESGARISVIEVSSGQNVRVTAVEPATWKHRDGQSSDLEGVCSIPERDGEFLLVEGGHYDGRFGRVFHVRVDVTATPYQVEVLYAFDLPEFYPKSRTDPDGDEIEGIACATRSDGTTLVVLGERGGSSVYRDGVLRWAAVDLEAPGPPRFSAAGLAGKTVNAPGAWSNPSRNRDISALYLDSDNTLWAAASEDLGDVGPFRSIVYRIAEVSADDPDPIRLVDSPSVTHTVDGFKIEALAAPAAAIKGSVLAIGTEDEAFGGVWRPLR